ncbi:MAG: sensor histidine kinase [Anaerolineales bacterium]|nr:sensor histidine kinase [Anaerolineales bacterium]
MKKKNFLSRLLDDERNFVRPFFLFLTLVLVGIYIWVLIDSPVKESVWKIVVFTILMNLHILLYWLSPWIFEHPRWMAPYLIFQGLLAFAMGMLTRVIGITLGLYPGLIGLVIGLPVKPGWRVLAVGYFLSLSLANYLILTGPGATLWWVMATVPITLFVSIYVIMYLRQAEAREQAQVLLQELEAANRQLTEYVAQVEDLTILNERQRMARELHDTLSQGLAGLIMQMEAVDAHLAGERPERARDVLQLTMEKARVTLAEARRAIDDLRQPGTLGLGEAVRLEVERFTASTGIPCETKIFLPEVLPPPLVEAVVRVVAEGLTNIARHARAHTSRLQMTGAEDARALVIELADDGIGFDPAAVEAGHYGLLGMRERLRLVDGSLEVRSVPGEGTRVLIQIPLPEAPRD